VTERSERTAVLWDRVGSSTIAVKRVVKNVRSRPGPSSAKRQAIVMDY